MERASDVIPASPKELGVTWGRDGLALIFLEKTDILFWHIVLYLLKIFSSCPMNSLLPCLSLSFYRLGVSYQANSGVDTQCTFHLFSNYST